MKTTIDLPDATFRQAKTVAAARGMTLKRLLTEALEERLRRCAVETGNGGVEPPSGWPGSARYPTLPRRTATSSI